MTAIRSMLGRFRPDKFLMMLIATVALSALFPAHGRGTAVADVAVYIAVALLFLLYGARLAPAAIWAGLSHWRLQLMILASTFVLFPLIGLGMGVVESGVLPRDIVFGLLFLCLLPSTVQSSIAFTSIARGNVPAALCAASLSNLLGVVVTPVLVALLLPAASVGISPRALENIGMQILLPFVAGQAIRPLVGGWLSQHKALTTMVDRGSILVVVYAAFSAGMVAGIWTQVSVVDLLLVIAFNLIVLGIVISATTWGSRALGFSTEDEIAIVFCGSKKSMASGIPIAAILFPGHAVGLIVLPLMLFHQAQLFVCAVLARRYGARTEAAHDGRSTAPDRTLAAS